MGAVETDWSLYEDYLGAIDKVKTGETVYVHIRQLKGGEYVATLADGQPLKTEILIYGKDVSRYLRLSGSDEIKDDSVYTMEIVKVDDEAEWCAVGSIAKPLAREINAFKKEALNLQIDEIINSNTMITITVKEVNKGGMVGEYDGVRVFAPDRSLLLKREQRERFIGREVRGKIVGRSGNSVVVSLLGLIEDEQMLGMKREIESLHAGSQINCIIKSAVKGGMIARTGAGTPVFVPQSHIDYGDYTITPGTEINVKVLSIDYDLVQIKASRKQTLQHPLAALAIKPGRGLSGVVNNVHPELGAFIDVDLGDGVQMSALAYKEFKVKRGDKVLCKVTRVDNKKNKLSVKISDNMAVMK